MNRMITISVKSAKVVVSCNLWGFRGLVQKKIK